MHLRRAHRRSFDKVSLAPSSEFRDETVTEPIAQPALGAVGSDEGPLAGDAGEPDVALTRQRAAALAHKNLP
jgi:hypothetical protein